MRQRHTGHVLARAAVLAVLATTGAGCARATDGSATVTPVTAARPGTPVPSPPAPVQSPPASGAPGTPVARSPEAQAAVDAALRDAAARLGVDAAQLRVERADQREWNDSSLGCPQPGMMYLQVITPGYLVIVAGPGPSPRRLEYHTDTRGRAAFCRDL